MEVSHKRDASFYAVTIQLAPLSLLPSILLKKGRQTS